MALSFGCKVSQDEVVRLDDLPIEDLQRIADENGLESWFDLYMQPARYGKATIALYRHCCSVAKVDPIDPVTPAVVLQVFEPIQDDLPTLWENGHPQTADDQTTA